MYVTRNKNFTLKIFETNLVNMKSYLLNKFWVSEFLRWSLATFIAKMWVKVQGILLQSLSLQQLFLHIHNHRIVFQGHKKFLEKRKLKKWMLSYKNSSLRHHWIISLWKTHARIYIKSNTCYSVTRNMEQENRKKLSNHFQRAWLVRKLAN